MAKPSRLPLIPLALLAVLAVSVVVCRIAYRPRPADRAATPGAAALGQITSVDGMTAEEIFRRAFWRQPSAEDRILRTERREHRAEIGDPETLHSWRWFIELHPGPELLRALRDPDIFGLVTRPPSAAPLDWSTGAEAPPDWFPAAPAATDFELLQTPAGHLTVLYRASDNLLYATDHGQGFASPARPR